MWKEAWVKKKHYKAQFWNCCRKLGHLLWCRNAATWGISLCTVVKRFVNVHLHCIFSNLKRISKMSTFLLLGKFSTDAHAARFAVSGGKGEATIADYLHDHTHHACHVAIAVTCRWGCDTIQCRMLLWDWQTQLWLFVSRKAILDVLCQQGDQIYVDLPFRKPAWRINDTLSE